MTDRAKKIYDGLSEEALRKHYSTAPDKESRDYIQERLAKLNIESALIEQTEIKQGEFFT